MHPQEMEELNRLLRELLDFYPEKLHASGSDLIEWSTLLIETGHLWLFMNVDILNFSIRSDACLDELDIRLIGELVQLKPEDLLKRKNFGIKSLEEVQEILGYHNLRLGMELDEQTRAALYTAAGRAH